MIVMKLGTTNSKIKYINLNNKMAYLVYILRCSDGKLYTEYTEDIERRLKEHREGKGSRFTRSRLPLRVVFTEQCSSRVEAMRKEAEIKKLSKKEKIELIKSQDFNKLYDLIIM